MVTTRQHTPMGRYALSPAVLRRAERELPDLTTTGQAAAILGRDRRTINIHARRGKFAGAKRLGCSVWIIPKAALLAFYARQG